MKKAYIFLSILMVIVAISLLILPRTQKDIQISPEELLVQMSDQSRYLSTDRVAGMIISQDPSLLLIDVRDSVQFRAYHLPGAFLIPLTAIAESEYSDLLRQEGKVVVFYSNGDVSAEQAWVLCKRMGLKNIYVMKDGLNRWMETIIKPEKPAETAGSEEIDLYQFRMGASAYFGGGSVEPKSGQATAEPVMLQKKGKKGAAEGGC
jgi:sulfur-carrier protein adenylyltransferase/sulfurtransferase